MLLSSILSVRGMKMWLKVLHNGIIYHNYQTTTLNKKNFKKIPANNYYLLLYLSFQKIYVQIVLEGLKFVGITILLNFTH